jgi:hypothetical protein
LSRTLCDTCIPAALLISQMQHSFANPNSPLNTLLGRGDSSRFGPVTFEEIVSRVRFYEERGLLGKLRTISANDEIVLGIIMAAVHEIELSTKGQQYSSSNKGAEIREGTEFVLRCLNSHAEKIR